MAEKSKTGDKDIPSDEEGNTTTWNNKMEFIMAAVSSAIGLGNLWRFPYQCYKNGGGAFLVPFLVMVLVAGFPQVLADLTLGQYSQSGAVRSYRAAPIMQGVGWLLILLSLHVDVYYVVVVSYTVFYTFASFTTQLPWEFCGNWWNTDDCTDSRIISDRRNCSTNNGSWINNICYYNGNIVENITNGSLFNASLVSSGKLVDASEEYFHNYVLQISSGIADIGLPRWPIVLCVILTLILVFITLSLGVKTWGKLAYIFALLPYIVLGALLIQSLLHDGAANGILYFLKPRWSELAKPKVWVDAVGQAFFSLSCTGGALITIGSFNHFRNNCFRDSVIVTTGDTLTSLLCGIVVFSILGLMAHDLDVSVDKVVGKGAGMTFVVYSAALARLPSAPVWSAIFMLMLVNLGVGTVVSIIATIQKVIVELLPIKFQKRRLYQTLVLLATLTVFFLLGLLYTTNGGMYVLQMMDMNVTYVMVIVGILKTITITWIYGISRLYDDVKTMSGYRPWQVFGWVHKYVTPSLLVFVLIFNFTQFKPLTYGDYVFPVWAEAIGWLLTFITLLVVPGVAIYNITKVPGALPLIKRIQLLCKPVEGWDYKEGKEVLSDAELKLQVTTPSSNVDPGTEDALL